MTVLQIRRCNAQVAGVPRWLESRTAYEHLRSESPIFQALIDAHCCSWMGDSGTESNRELQRWSQPPHTFLIGVMEIYMELQHDVKKTLEQCDYHGYGSEDGGKNCQVPRVVDSLLNP